MHFTSAFISTLLSASTVLAQGLSSYAGFRVTAGNTFVYSSAVVKIPDFSCNSYEFDPQAILFVGAAIGNPLTCDGGGGIEAGFAFACLPNRQKVIRAYWKLFPNEVEYVHPTWFPDGIAEGHTMFMEVRTEDSGVFVTITNTNTHQGTSRQHVGGIQTIIHCLETAAWVVRALINANGGELMSIPGFQHIDFNVMARDTHDLPYGPETNGVEDLRIRNSDGDVLVRADSTGDFTFTVS